MIFSTSTIQLFQKTIEFFNRILLKFFETIELLRKHLLFLQGITLIWLKSHH